MALLMKQIGEHNSKHFITMGGIWSDNYKGVERMHIAVFLLAGFHFMNM
jgi:hypothetical protein